MAMYCYYKISLKLKRMKRSLGIHPFGLLNAEGTIATLNKLLMFRALSNLLRGFFVTENQMLSLSESGWSRTLPHSSMLPFPIFSPKRAIHHFTMPFSRKIRS